jgi:transcriptional regulator
MDEAEGPYGTLYGHLAKANYQWRLPPRGEALALFSGPDAYVTPSWYETKETTGKVVPTWVYVAVHAYGSLEFFDEPGRLHEVVSRLTAIHESGRDEPWAVTDAPASYIQSQLKGIMGLRLPITRLEGKNKMEQRANLGDRRGVAKGLSESSRTSDGEVAPLILVDPRRPSSF